MDKIRVLLADDHALFREGLAGIIENQPDMQVVGEANDGLEALVMAKELKPDLILMDVQMPTLDGLEATLQIKQALPETTIVVLTVRDDSDQLFEAIKNGAQGYILKDIRSHKLIEMLRSALKGEAAISPALAGRVLSEFRRLSRSAAPSDGDQTLLTEREQEVLKLVAENASDKEIAEALTVSLNTVKTHMRNILSKLHVGTRREATRLARSKGLV